MSEPFLVETDLIIVNTLGGLELELKAKVRDNLAGDDAYEWDFGDGTPRVVNGYEVTHVFEPGTYTVSLSIETTEGTLTDQVEITIDSNGHRSFEEPEPQELEEETPFAA